MKRLFVVIMTVLLVLTACTGVDIPKKAALQEDEEILETLPVVGTYENFKRLVEKAQEYSPMFDWSGGRDEMVEMKASVDEAVNTGSPDHSKTNIQVEGVDEADIVKTDGSFLYYVNGKRVIIAKAYPPENMEVVNALSFDDINFFPNEIYIDGSYLVVIGTSSRAAPHEPLNMDDKKAAPYYQDTSTVKVIVYNMENRKNIRKLRQAEIEGFYISSRKIGTNLHIVSNKYVDYYILREGMEEPNPSYMDSVSSEEFTPIGYDDIRYFPDALCNNYMIIGSLDISSMDEMKVSTYLGVGQSIYVSNDNLYAAVTKYDKDWNPPPRTDNKELLYYQPPSLDTLVYRFTLSGGNALFKAKGEVPGTILNQFSMDEYDGYFRIAATTNDMPSKNSIYVLNGAMEVVGRIEDMAPGERIYSVRFMGDRGYVVTFETVDPLFVIDLKDPQKPEILGALKIPGYSNYLHPYDTNHVIGFGKDTVVLPAKDRYGNTVDDQAYYTGMKIALFDITNVNNPREMFTLKIGDRGTESEILHNHKALLFSKEKNLLAFPVSLFELEPGQDMINREQNFPEYGTFSFQGAYVYSIGLEEGFSLRGRITHMDDEDYRKSGKYQYDGEKYVERIIYIGDTLYTLSRSMLKASDIATTRDISKIQMPYNSEN